MSPAAAILVFIVVFGIALAIQNASRKAARQAGILATFADLKLTATQLIEGTVTHSLDGLTARVEDSGTLNRRITATRLMTIGVFALAAKKKQDDREVYLTIEGDTVAIVRTVQFKSTPEAGAAARNFAAQLNLLSRKTAAAAATTAQVPTTTFEVVLMNPGAQKIQVIKTVREAVPGLGLKEARDLVATAPSVLARGVDSGRASQIQTQLERAGAAVMVNDTP